MSSSTRVLLAPKRAADVVIEPFDFISYLAPAETILTQVVTASVWSGVDANPGAIISGAATAAGTVVSQKIQAGVVGVIYLLICKITTSLGQTLQLGALLSVLPDGI
jgi:hypothetical protein